MRGALVFAILTIFLLTNLSALRINEVELNPPGTDAGKEWLEIYSEEKVDLSGYKLVNNDGKEINLNGTVNEYFVYNFGKQWLDNSDEKVSLYKGSKLIDETDILKDSENNDKTWQYCTSWIFKESTKDETNGCEEETDKKQETEIRNNSYEDTSIINKTSIAEQETIKQEAPKIIQLTSKTIKSEDNKDDNSKYAIYGLIGLSVFIIALLFLRRRDKSEFR